MTDEFRTSDEVQSEWRDWKVPGETRVLVASLWFCFLLSFFCFIPMWRERRVGLTTDKPVEEVCVEKEMDMKLRAIQALDKYNAEMAHYLNTPWRKSMMEMCRNPELQEQASSAFAEIVQGQINTARVKQGLAPIDHLTSQVNVEAMAAEDRQAKEQFWMDLKGERDVFERFPGDGLAAYNRKQLQNEFKKTLDTGVEETKDSHAFFERLFAVQAKAQEEGKELSIPLEFFNEFADNFLN